MGSQTPGPTNFILIHDHSWVKLSWFPEGERGGINWETGWTQTRCDVGNVLSPVRLSVTPWTVARQAPLTMEFSRQEYWSGLSTQELNPGLLHCRQISNHLSCKGTLEVKWLDTKREF